MPYALIREDKKDFLSIFSRFFIGAYVTKDRLTGERSLLTRISPLHMGESQGLVTQKGG